jgi:hypothetical protein
VWDEEWDDYQHCLESFEKYGSSGGEGGFVPANSAPVNNLGQFSIAQLARNAQNLDLTSDPPAHFGSHLATYEE